MSHSKGGHRAERLGVREVRVGVAQAADPLVECDGRGIEEGDGGAGIGKVAPTGGEIRGRRRGWDGLTQGNERGQSFEELLKPGAACSGDRVETAVLPGE